MQIASSAVAQQFPPHQPYPPQYPLPSRGQVDQLRQTFDGAFSLLANQYSHRGQVAQGAGMLQSGGAVLAGVAPHFGLLAQTLIDAASKVLAAIEHDEPFEQLAESAGAAALAARDTVAQLPTRD